MRTFALLLSLLLGVTMHNTRAEDLVYQQAPAPIPSILDAPDKPYLVVSPDGRMALELLAESLPSIEEVAIDAVEVAGLRFNPATNGEPRTWFARSAVLVDLVTLERRSLELPDPMRGHSFNWSPDGKHIAWCRTTADGARIWITNVKDGSSRRLSPRRLNTIAVEEFLWQPGSDGVVCGLIPGDRGAAPEEGTPTGPIIEESLGHKGASRTWTNLLQTRHDEALFEYYLAAELTEIDLKGRERRLHKAALLMDYEVSPDGRWILVETVHRPYSYTLPLWRFPQRSFVIERKGGRVTELCDLPLADAVPIAFGSVPTGPRSIRWRQDKPATLCWAEALDGGDAEREASERDRILLHDAPFKSDPVELCRTQDRYGGIYWGDATRALLYESWYADRRQRILRLNPATGKLDLLIERASDDAYSDPGSPRTKTWPDGHWSLRFHDDGRSIFWSGRGASEEGVYPFLSTMNWNSGKFTRIWQSRDPWYERVLSMLDGKGERLLVRRESQLEPENDYLLERPDPAAFPPRSTKNYRHRRITDYQDPAPQLAGMQQEVVRYQRADGVELSATVYLPPGYEAERDGPLPFLLWVYPREFKSRAAAGRVTASENVFSRPAFTSVLFLLTQGVAIMANPTLPILGENDDEPNDTYLEQLEAGARAAVDHLVSQGIGDPERMAIGGHSYGAFTAANLVAHTDLFRTAICRSGAYNRTLTPFGFQGEERHFWEAGDAYLRMSPFMHADQITEPVLLIHGLEDPNAGTYPMQSERFYEALKGLGREVRLVKLPGEGHGYRSRESIGHVLWEMCRWCELHLKPAPPPEDVEAGS